MRRRQLLARPDAPQLWAIVDESVLMRVLGSREVMREQLEHLVEMAQYPHVTLQFVPLDVTNASAPAIPVTYLRFGGLDLPDIVYLEHIRSANFLEDRDETEEYRMALDRLADEALNPANRWPCCRDARGALLPQLTTGPPIAGPWSADPADAAELDPFLGELAGCDLRVRPPSGHLHQSGLKDVHPLEPGGDVLLLAHTPPVSLGGLGHEVGDELTDLRSC